MSEYGHVEAKRGDLALAASSFLDILKSYWIAEPQDVHADIRLRSVVAHPAKRKAACPAQ